MTADNERTCATCGGTIDPKWGHGAVDCFDAFRRRIAALEAERDDALSTATLLAHDNHGLLERAEAAERERDEVQEEANANREAFMQWWRLAKHLMRQFDLSFNDLPAPVPEDPAESRLAIAVRALEEIDALDIPSFDGFPPDWREQIETCPECQGWAKHHPIQQGICDEHRRPLWARERHEKQERAAIGPRAQVIAHTILAQIAKENTDAAS